MVISTLAALASACLFAVTTNLQRAAASSVPSEGTGPLHLVRRLVTDRRWLAGGLIGGAALALHAVALARGAIMVVQSIMALGLVIALAVEARREGRGLRRNELGGAALVVLGVAVVVSVSRPADPSQARSGAAAVACAVVALLALAAVVRSRHSVGTRWEARVLAAAGGACFAVDAVFLQRVASLVDRGLGDGPLGVVALTAAGDLVGFFGASAVGTVAIHRAYQVAPLREVQPALAAAEPVTAFAVGVAVLHEGVRGGVPGFLVLVAGLAALVAGIFVGLIPALAARPSTDVVPVDGAASDGAVPVAGRVSVTDWVPVDGGRPLVGAEPVGRGTPGRPPGRPEGEPVRSGREVPRARVRIPSREVVPAGGRVL